MKKLIFLFCITCFINQLFSQTSQSNCPNSDFSQGNFNNWDAYYGTFYNPTQYHGFDPNRHVINAAPGSLDPNTCYGLLTVPPGEAYSARLGNDNIGAEAEQLRYSITVTPETNLFIYKYAVVLEDPGHIPENQPSFTIEVTDENGVVFDPICGYYYVYAQQGLPGWSTCGSVVWKNWTIVGLNLAPYMGQIITIVFTTRDCEQTGHYGYAYLSAACGKLQMAVSYCPQDSYATLTAPSGFSYLWSNGQTSQSIIVSNPIPGSTDSCILTSVNGCQVTIYASLFPTIVNSDFSYVSNCPNFPVNFTDLSTVNQNAITNWKWDFGDGSAPVTNIQNPSHSYTNSGTYNVTLIAYSSEGCCDTIVKPLIVYSNVNSDFSYISKCTNIPVPFFDSSTIIQDTIINWKWDFGDGSAPVTNIQNPTHAYSSMGTYNVMLTAYSSMGCNNTIIKPVVVKTNVNSNFSYISKCINIAVPFLDLSTVNQDTIINWQWDFGDGSAPVTNIPNPTHIYTNSGTYYTTLIAYSSEGCDDTIIKPVIVYPLPYIQFYQNTSLITDTSIVLCPFDTINLNASNCGITYEWTKKTMPHWFSNDQSIEVSNPGMGTYVETYYLKVTNNNNCISTDSLNVLWDFNGCNGINEYNNFITTIFPNPTTGEVTINMEQSCDISSVELFNFQGQILYKQKYNNYHTNQLSLDLTNFKKGIYYLKISLNNRFEIKKIISY